MFVPKYTITDSLLAKIKRITTLVHELNAKRFSSVVLFQFEKSAQALSTHASTSIEGNPLPLTEVKKLLKSKPSKTRDSEKEVLNYNEALENLNKTTYQPPFELSINLIVKTQGVVTNELLPKHDCGKLRKKPVVINNPKTRQIVFIPPDADDVSDLLNELLDFVHEKKDLVDPLILAGIFHKQMVIIHPFMDGNGRTTRLMTNLLLKQLGLNTFNLFSFENYYNQNVSKYFQMVGECGDYYELAPNVDFTPWLEYFADGIIDELQRVQKALPISANPQTELKPYHEKLVKDLQKRGYIADSHYAKLVDRAKATRALDFSLLRSYGIIEKRGQGRATYYVLSDT